MGKLSKRLEEQKADTEHSEDAYKCLRVYCWLLSVNSERVWSGEWTTLTKISWAGKYPNSKAVYKLSTIGKMVLDGIKSNESEEV